MKIAAARELSRLHFTRAPTARKSLAQTAECTKRLNMDEEVKSRQVKPPEDQTNQRPSLSQSALS